MLTHLLLGAVIGAVIGWFLGNIGTGAILGAVIAGGIHWMRNRGESKEEVSDYVDLRSGLTVQGDFTLSGGTFRCS